MKTKLSIRRGKYIYPLGLENKAGRHSMSADLPHPRRTRLFRPGRLPRILAAAWLTLVLLPSEARAIAFAFSYQDEPETGFLDPAVGEQRREALAYAAEIWGRLILPSFEGEVIEIRAQFADYAPGSTTLANGGANLSYSDFGSSSPAYVENVFYPQPLANHLNGEDVASALHEINITINSASNYYYGTDGNPGMQFDFVSVALHEIGHGLGFNTAITESGTISSLALVYDRFLTLGEGGPALLGMSDSARAAALISGDVFWNGPAGTLGNGGTPPAVFAPATWSGTSSIAHVSDANAVMSPSIGVGVVQHVPTGIDRGILQDMGWSISAVSRGLFWTGEISGDAGAAGNWGPNPSSVPLPGDSLTFGGSAAQMEVDVPFSFHSFESITFSAGALPYRLYLQPEADIDLTVDGIVNASAGEQTIVMYSGFTPGGSGAAKLAFRGNAAAGNATSYLLSGGNTALDGNPNVGYIFLRTPGAALTFHNTSSAGDSSMEVEGGSGDGGFSATVKFTGQSTAGTAAIRNLAGRIGPTIPVNGSPAFQAGFGGHTRFEQNSTAGAASIENEGVAVSVLGTGGYTLFTDNAQAGEATIRNLGGNGFQRGGFTEFTADASADSATFHNAPGINTAGGRTVFFERSTAADGAFFNGSATGEGSADGQTTFRGETTAARANITNLPRGITQFFDDATAAEATIRFESPENVSAGGMAEFNDRSTAATATLRIEGGLPGNAHGGWIRFLGTSTAGESTIIAEPAANGFEISFRDESHAGEAFINLRDLSQAHLFFEGNSSADDAQVTIGAFASLHFLGSAHAGTSEITVAARATMTVVEQANLGESQLVVEGSDIPWVTGPDGGGDVQIRGGGSAGAAAVTIEGGAVAGARGGRVTLDTDGKGGDAHFHVESGAEGAAGGILTFTRFGSAPGARVIAQDGAKVVIDSFILSRDTAIGSISGAGTFELGGHLVTGQTNDSTTVSGRITGHAPLTKLGTGELTLSGENTYIGLTTVAQGAVIVNGSIPGSVVVNSGAALKGTGTIGGNVTVNSGGIFAPGTSPGTITIGSLDLLAGGVFHMELGTQRDFLAVNGAVSLAGSLRISLFDSYAPKSGDVIPLFQAAGAVSGGFATYEFPDLLPGFEYSAAFSGGVYSLTALNDAQLVPEPASWIILLFAGGAMAGLQRFRRA